MGIGPGTGRGGPRPGSGRPKGSKNKLDTTLQERLQEDGADPVEILKEIMLSSDKVNMRAEAAKALLPYTYPRLSTVDMNVSGAFGSVELRIVADDDDSV